MQEFKRIGIVGNGKMGSSIFLYLNRHDFELCWLCRSAKSREDAWKLFLKKIDGQLHCGVLSEKEHHSRVERTVITIDPHDLQDCDLVIEAITEDLLLKKDLFAELDRVVNSTCIFTSNSSSIFPSLLTPSDTRKEKFAGMHFFFPVQLKQYVELISTDSTSDATTKALDHFLTIINKRSLVLEEENAFLLNRLFLDMQAGAYRLYQEGKLSMTEIDNLVKSYLFPIGVFEFFDHVGIDVMLTSVRNYSKGYANGEFYAPLIMAMDSLVRDNRLGIKTKQGFLDYSLSGASKAHDRNSNNPPNDYDVYVIRRLWELFSGPVRAVLSKGIISSEELSEALKDYTGTDKDLMAGPEII